MRFKVSDKVKVKESFVSQLQSPSLIENLRGEGDVIGMWRNCNNYLCIKFKNGRCYYLYGTDLEKSTKNQQLLFNFIE